MSTGERRPTLVISGLTVGIGGAAVVRGVDLELQEGTRLGLLGASGSGKSLTAAAIAGCLPGDAVTGGSIEIAGVPVLGVPAARRTPAARCGVVFQDSATALNPMVRVGRQLGEPLRRQGLDRRAAVEHARDLLSAVGLADPDRALAAHPGALSGGQRQRVALALALACHVRLLVADEPTTALDVLTQAAVVDLLRSRTGGPGAPALLFITHDVAVASQLCDEIAVLDEGVVVEHGSAHDIVRRPGHPATRRLLEAARSLEDDLTVAAAVAS